MSNLATFREAGRVGSKFFNLAPGRVGSGQGPGGSGWVGSEKVTRGQLWCSQVDALSGCEEIMTRSVAV